MDPCPKNDTLNAEKLEKTELELSNYLDIKKNIVRVNGITEKNNIRVKSEYKKFI